MAGRTSKGPQHIGVILDDLIRERGLEETLHANRAVLLWEESVGEPVSRRTKALQVEADGTLVVGVESPAWIHHLQMEEEDLRARINDRLGETLVRRIRFRLAPSESIPGGPGEGPSSP